MVGIVPGWGNFNLLLLQTEVGRYLRNIINYQNFIKISSMCLNRKQSLTLWTALHFITYNGGEVVLDSGVAPGSDVVHQSAVSPHRLGGGHASVVRLVRHAPLVDEGEGAGLASLGASQGVAGEGLVLHHVLMGNKTENLLATPIISLRKMFNVIKVEGLIGIEDLHDSREALPDVLGAEGDAGRVTGPQLTDSQTKFGKNIFTLLSTELSSPLSVVASLG